MTPMQLSIEDTTYGTCWSQTCTKINSAYYDKIRIFTIAQCLSVKYYGNHPSLNKLHELTNTIKNHRAVPLLHFYSFIND